MVNDGDDWTQHRKSKPAAATDRGDGDYDGGLKHDGADVRGRIRPMVKDAAVAYGLGFPQFHVRDAWRRWIRSRKASTRPHSFWALKVPELARQ